MRKLFLISFTLISIGLLGQPRNILFAKASTDLPGYYRSITVDHTKCGSTDLTNFPITFAGTYTYLKTVANGGKVEDAQGDDIYFSTDIAGSSKLSFRQTYWSATTGACEYTILIPTLTNATDYVFYLQYGNSSITTFQGGSTGAAYNSAYIAVWSLADGSTLSGSDGTSNGITLTLNSTPGAIAGKIDGGGDLGSSATLSTASSSLNLTTYTYEGWAKSSSTGQFWERGDGGLNVNSYLWWQTGANRWVFGFYNGSTFQDHYYSTDAPDDNTWHRYTLVMNDASDLIQLYIDGVQKVSEAETTSPTTAGTQTLYIGTNRFGVNHWNTYIDEFRISNTARTSDWILVSYNTQNDPSTFYTIGSEI